MKWIINLIIRYKHNIVLTLGSVIVFYALGCEFERGVALGLMLTFIICINGILSGSDS